MKAVNRRCSYCRKKCPADGMFNSHLKAFCSMDCLMAYTKSETGRRAIHKAVKTQNNKEKAKIREKHKKRGDYVKEAQAAINAYVRWRDKDKDCISCGKSLKSESLGGGYDAGHYRSRGSAPHMRFRLDNIFGQCKRCNRYLSGATDKMRVGIVWRYGQQFLDRIETDNESKQYSIEDLQRIKQIFTRKLNIKKQKQ